MADAATAGTRSRRGLRVRALSARKRRAHVSLLALAASHAHLRLRRRRRPWRRRTRSCSARATWPARAPGQPRCLFHRRGAAASARLRPRSLAPERTARSRRRRCCATSAPTCCAVRGLRARFAQRVCALTRSARRRNAALRRAVAVPLPPRLLRRVPGHAHRARHRRLPHAGLRAARRTASRQGCARRRGRRAARAARRVAAHLLPVRGGALRRRRGLGLRRRGLPRAGVARAARGARRTCVPS